MSRIVRWSCGIYAALLPLYPPEIRRRFEAELVDTFAQQVGDAWEEGRIAGVLGVWFFTLPELLWITLPRQIVRPVVVLPVVSLMTTSAIMFSLIWALENSLVLNAWYHSVAGSICR